MIYIPTKQQRQKICLTLACQNNQNVNHENILNSQAQKKISKFQQQNLIERLMKNTKKHYQIQASINKMQIVNQKIKKVAANDQKVQNRLLKQGQKIKNKKQQLAKKIEKHQKQNICRDKPKITKIGKEVVQKPIHSRITQILEKKLINVKNLEQKYKPLFEPVINPYSQFIIEIDDEGDFFQRMIKNQEKTKQKLLEKKKCFEDQLFNENIKPSFVNKKSQIILAQKNYKRRSKSILCNQTTKQINITQIVHHPKINRKSVQMLNSKPQYNEGNCFNRLYSRQKTNKDKLRKQMQKQLTFKPKINRKKQTFAQKVIQKAQSNQNQQLFQVFVKKPNSIKSQQQIQHNFQQQYPSDSFQQQCPHFSNICQSQNKGQQNKNRVKFSKSEWSRITKE